MATATHGQRLQAVSSGQYCQQLNYNIVINSLQMYCFIQKLYNLRNEWLLLYEFSTDHSQTLHKARLGFNQVASDSPESAHPIR